MKKLKKTCRTCKYLNPTTYLVEDYDIEGNYCPEKYPCNCGFIDNSDDVDALMICEHYESIDENYLYEEQ